MTVQAMNQFLGSIGTDPATVEGLVAAVGDRQGVGAVEAVAAFARSCGFDVDAEDAARIRQSMIDAIDCNRDLSDAELANVDGGAVLETVVLGGAFIAGAVTMIAAGAAVGAAASPLYLIPAVQDWVKQW